MKPVKAARSVLITLAFLIISGFISTSRGQDILELKSGREIKAIIVEEKPDVITYREYEDPTGPLFSVARDKVASVKYKKGNRPQQGAETNQVKKEEEPAAVSDNQLLTAKKRYVLLNDKIQSPRQVKLLMEDYPEAFDLYSSGRKMCNASNGCAAGMIGVSLIANLVSNGMEASEGRKVIVAALGISGGLVISGIVLASGGKKKIRRSVSMYNNAISKPVSLKLNLNLSYPGAGIVMDF